ncbi:MAG: rod-binding protein [Verrucomicrobiae bacterium]|nr:rod-binding protein [Verrucomicrobiae bacterium]
MLSPIPPLRPPAPPATPLEELARRPQPDDPARRAEAARQFEAMLVRQILNEAQKPLFRSTLVKDSTASAIYRDQLTAQLADAVTQGDGLGLARALCEQWQTPSTPALRRPTSHEGAP